MSVLPEYPKGGWAEGDWTLEVQRLRARLAEAEAEKRKAIDRAKAAEAALDNERRAHRWTQTQGRLREADTG
jgi:hypothetical protein